MSFSYLYPLVLIQQSCTFAEEKGADFLLEEMHPFVED
jgi:hypothetical protein